MPPRLETDALLRPLIDDAEDMVMQPFAVWLADGATPDDWHRSMLGWNWDAGEAVPRWIARQPDCDRATALLIFWNGSPEYFVSAGGGRRAASARRWRR